MTCITTIIIILVIAMIIRETTILHKHRGISKLLLSSVGRIINYVRVKSKQKFNHFSFGRPFAPRQIFVYARQQDEYDYDDDDDDGYNDDVLAAKKLKNLIAQQRRAAKADSAISIGLARTSLREFARLSSCGIS